MIVLRTILGIYCRNIRKKYPDILDIHRNEHNLGIYGNVAQAASYLPDFDLYGELSGDDSYCNGYFERIQKLIDKQSIDTSEAIGFFSDFKIVNNEGKEKVFKQDSILTGYNLMSLKIRGIISSRSLMVTKRVFDSYEPLLVGKGLNLMENQYDLQPHLIIKISFYLPQVTTIYYSGLGVSVNISNKRSAYNTTESIEFWNYCLENYIKNKRDFHFAKYELVKAHFYLRPSFFNIPVMYYHFSLGQLPKLRLPIIQTLRLFLSYMKFWIKN